MTRSVPTALVVVASALAFGTAFAAGAVVKREDRGLEARAAAPVLDSPARAPRIAAFAPGGPLPDLRPEPRPRRTHRRPTPKPIPRPTPNPVPPTPNPNPIPPNPDPGPAP